MSSLLPRFPTFPLPHFAVSLPLHFLAFSRHSVSGDDWKAAQIPLVACPALLSNHPHWQSAWNRLPHCTTSPLPHFPASTLSYFFTSLLPCLPSSLLSCFPTSPLPCFPASLLLSFPAFPLPYNVLSCFPSFLFPSSLQCTFLLPFFPLSLFPTMYFPASLLSSFPLPCRPASLFPHFPASHSFLLSLFPAFLLSVFPSSLLSLCYRFNITQFATWGLNGGILWLAVHWSLEGDGHWLWISFLSAVSLSALQTGSRD